MRTLVWGATLGPGLMTRNPYAGIWLMPLLIAVTAGPLAGALTGATVGAAHGLGRAFATIEAVRVRSRGPRMPTEFVLHQLRWRLADGLALSFIAGVLLVYAV
jgi:hypothetical protein